MQIPDQVKIGGLVFTVEKVRPTPLELQAEGNINYRELSITVCDTGKEYTVVTFLHECIHGMLEALGFTQANQDEQ